MDKVNPVKIQILLSTWNGERWLPELLESLRQQRFQDWQLLVRDDGSSDQTIRILLDWQRRHPEKVTDLLLDGVNLGSTQSFSRLVEASHAPYLAFCDQDDIWFPEKLEAQYAAIRWLEGEYGDHVPALTHSDLVVVDAVKQLLSPSLWGMRGLNCAQRRQAYLLTNVVTGCATLFNRAAARKAFPAPLEAMQHDRWLALVCVWFGHIRPEHYPLLFYRQHGVNQIGASGSVQAGDIADCVNAWSLQAEAFRQRFAAELSVEDYKLVEALAELRHLQGWERRRHILQHRLFKQGMLKNLALLLFG